MANQKSDNARQTADEEKAKAEAAANAEEARLADEAKALLRRGPIARQEIRFRKKTYAPGEELPGDIEDDVVSSLKRLGAI